MVTYLNDHWTSKEKIQYNKTETYKTLLAVPNSIYNTQLQLFTNWSWKQSVSVTIYKKTNITIIKCSYQHNPQFYKLFCILVFNSIKHHVIKANNTFKTEA